MSAVKALVLRAAGTNCDRETVHALELAGARVETMHVSRLADEPARLDRFGILVIPGGFTYGDDVGAGRILAFELRHRLGEAIERFGADGRLVLGICNGFQVLVQMGLLPGIDGVTDRGALTLTDNDSGKFECRWVTLECRSPHGIFCPLGRRLRMPVAHAEGKVVVADESVVDQLEAAGQIAFVYVDPDGGSAVYPYNPNGSVSAIAGVTDPTGRVLGLMPHPERNVILSHRSRSIRSRTPEGADGRVFFEGAVAYAREVAV